jgi:hypothetical protein
LLVKNASKQQSANAGCQVFAANSENEFLRENKYADSDANKQKGDEPFVALIVRLLALRIRHLNDDELNLANNKTEHWPSYRGNRSK